MLSQRSAQERLTFVAIFPGVPGGGMSVKHFPALPRLDDLEVISAHGVQQHVETHLSRNRKDKDPVMGVSSSHLISDLMRRVMPRAQREWG